MTDYLSEEEIFAAIPWLTCTRLIAFVETELIIPIYQEHAGSIVSVFRKVDCARMQLPCDLTDDFDLDEHALGVVLTPIDQLHVARHELLTPTRGVEAEP